MITIHSAPVGMCCGRCAMNRTRFAVGWLTMALLAVSWGCTPRQTPEEIAVPEKAAAPESSVLDQVDLFIGTAGDHGQLHPAATVPYGMIQLGPETTGNSHSGYDYRAAELLGFTHNRTSGVGCRGSGGNLLVRADYDRSMQGPAALHKESEQASPGYYRVDYGADRIRAEMTATAASGWQRYRFPRQGSVWLTVDLSHAHHRFYAGQYTLAENGAISGFISAATVCDEGRYKAYFSLSTSRTPVEIVEESDLRVSLRYQVEANDTLVVQAAFSSVDTQSAEARRAADNQLGDFDHIRRLARQNWQQKLGRFSVEGDPEKRQLFYSHLYRVFLSPHLLAEPGEFYRGSDGKRYQAGARPQYFGWSLWDTFRTKFPLLTIADSRVMEDITHSLADLYRQGKPLWATNTEPYLTVRTEHAGILLLDAWRKGIRGFDARELLPLLADEADNMPRQSPDQVLEAAYDDWAVGTFAELLGDTETADEYLARAAGYRGLWNEKFRVMGANADIMHGDGLYEGTLWQYRWAVPFDTAWLIAQLGGNDGFSDELQTFFDEQLFNMGNQPDIQAPFMFNFAGHPWRTQRQVHNLLNEPTVHWYGTHEKKQSPYRGKAFRAEPEAFIPEMDDDDGTMTAWYVFAAMGIYPAAPGVPVYTLHTPAFQRLSVELDNGKTFEVTTTEPGKPYIRSAQLNGEPLNRAWLTHDEIMQGATLLIVTAEEPNPQWGSDDIFTTAIDAGDKN